MKPLPSPKELQLLALVVKERSGREVAGLYERQSGQRISYGTLYTTLRRLREIGWVTVRDSVDDDGRVRHFRITRKGFDALNLGKAHFAELAGFGAGDGGEVPEGGRG